MYHSNSEKKEIPQQKKFKLKLKKNHIFLFWHNEHQHDCCPDSPVTAYYLFKCHPLVPQQKRIINFFCYASCPDAWESRQPLDPTGHDNRPSKGTKYTNMSCDEKQLSFRKSNADPDFFKRAKTVWENEWLGVSCPSDPVTSHCLTWGSLPLCLWEKTCQQDSCSQIMSSSFVCVYRSSLSK